MQRTFNVCAVTVPLLLAGCSSEESGRSGISAADAQSRLAATPQQAQLWKAAEYLATGGLDKLPVVESPVAPRARVTVQNRNAQPQPFSFPSQLVAGIAVVSAPELPEGKFSGVAQVARTDDERMDLDIGAGRIVSLYARANGSRLRVEPKDKVELDYRSRDGLFGRQAIVALRTPSGDGVVSVVESGRTPIAVQVPLFDLSAIQVGKAEQNSMGVEVRVGKERKLLTQGQTAEFPASGLSVGLLASAAYAGAAAARTEGNPYGVRIVAWSRR
jgi:hypothetical protein